MKNIIFLLSILLISYIAYSQNKSSDVETSNSGVFIEKSINRLSNLRGGVRVNLISSTNLINNEKSKAVAIELSPYSSIINKSELQEMINSLNLIIKTVSTEAVPKNRKEIYYKGLSGVEIGCYSGLDKWYSYIIVDRDYSKSLIEFEIDDLAELLEALNKANEML